MAVESTASSALAGLGPEHLRQLLALSQEFNATLELDALLPRIFRRVLATLDAEAGSLWMLEGQALHCRLTAGPETLERMAGLELPLGVGIVGDAVLRREPVLVADAQSDERFLHQLDAATGFTTRSVLAVPLIARDEVIGGIEVVNRRSGSGLFETEHLDFLVALSDDAAAAIRNTRLFEAEKRARDLKALLEVSQQITSTFDIERVLMSIVNLAGRAVRFDRCVLALWDADRLRVRAISGETAVDSRAAAVRELERVLLWVAESDEDLFISDLASDDEESAVQVRTRFPGYVDASGMRSLLLIHVHDAEGKLGLLSFEFASPGALGDFRREAAELLANQAALAIRNAQLYAEVPFISWLEPLAERRRRLAALPGAVWLRWALVAAAVVAVLTLVHFPLRISAESAEVRAAVQRPARAQVSGIVDAVWVREGEPVRAGAALAHVRDDDRVRQLREAQAAVDVADRDALAGAARGDDAAAAEARVRASAARDLVRLLSGELRRARVVAPADGVVLTPRVEERLGSWAEAGMPVVWIGDPDWSELELRVPQQDVGAVRPGDRVRARVSAHPEITFEGRVSAIAPGAQPGEEVPTVVVRAVLDNRRHLLLPGMAARAKVVTASRPLGVFLFRRPWRWLRMHLWW